MSNELELITKNKLENYLQISGVASNLSQEERTNFLQIAMDFNLNPFKREIYCTSYGQGEFRKTSIIIGYEVYIKRAERTGQLDGWQVTTSGSVANNDLKATITIYRKDRKFPFIHEVDYSEYVQTTFDKATNEKRPNKMWSEKPITMLKKVATAQGFRLCFADELGGMPYELEEMPNSIEREIQIQSQNKLIESANTQTIEAPPTSFIPPVETGEDKHELPEIGTEATKSDTELYFKSKKDFAAKFPGLELCKSATGKYVFQPFGTYAATKKAG